MIGQRIRNKLGEAFSRVKITLLSGNVFLAFAFSMVMIAPLITAIYIKIFGINCINTDQWEFLPLLDKMYSGTLTVGDLFAQHNEHRILFPKLVMLPLAYLTHYNNVAEMYFSWLIALAAFLLIFALYRRRAGMSTPAVLKFIPVAWLFFSLRQYANILWGWQIQIYMCIFAVIAAIYLLDRADKLNGWFCGAILAGILASFSFVNGLLVWPVGIAFLLISKPAAGRLKLSAAYGISGALAVIVYLYGWTMPGDSHSALSTPNPLGAAAQFFLANVGSPLAMEKGFALSAGIILLALVLVLAVLAIRGKAIAENAPWIALAMFSLLCSATITFGRLNLGLWEALASRYTSLTVLLVIGLYLIATDLFGRKDRGDGTAAVAYGMVAAVVLLCIVSGYIGGIYFGQMLHDNGIDTINTLENYTSASDEKLATVYPHVDELKERIEIMKRYNLNIF